MAVLSLKTHISEIILSCFIANLAEFVIVLYFETKKLPLWFCDNNMNSDEHVIE